MRELTIAEVARLAGGEVERGDADAVVTGVAPVRRAGPGELAFVAEPRDHPYIHASRAAAVLVARGTAVEAPVCAAVVRVDEPLRAVARILRALNPRPAPIPGIHPTAVLGDGVQVHPTASIGAYAVLGDGVTVGARTEVGMYVVAGPRCRIGAEVTLEAHATLYDHVTVGDGALIHGGARIGPDGFGFAWDGAGHRKIPQVGGCVLGAGTEVGANATIDRGSVGDTRLGDGCRLGDLVHIGHNARLGDGVWIDHATGIAGSATIEDGVTVGGQVAIMGHLTVGSGVRVARWGGVTQEIEPGLHVSGTPARPHRESRRAEALLRRLPRIVRRLERLERAVRGGGRGE